MCAKPIVSVCIPSYNSEAFIVPAVESVLHQTFADFEIIIADDKSDDRTVSLIKGIADRRIRLIENDKNLGLCGNMNRVLSFAAGDFVKLLCADDVIYPECLSRQVQVLRDPVNSGSALAVCNRDVINTSNRVLLRRKFPFGPGRVRGEKVIKYCIRSGLNLIGEPVVGLFRREILAKTRMCDPSNPYYVDLCLWAELLRHGDAFIDPEYLAAFRISGNSASARIGARQAMFFRRFVKGLRSDSKYRLTLLDSCLSSFLSFQWCVLRNLFIKFASC
jgi:glycosyltransferase involved in cell wall biosynthesis